MLRNVILLSVALASFFAESSGGNPTDAAKTLEEKIRAVLHTPQLVSAPFQGASFDDIVVGAGITGLWTANELAKAGRKVLLLEQFPRCTSRGGSAGSSRAIELSFPIIGAVSSFMNGINHYANLQAESGIQVIADSDLLVLTDDPMEGTPFPALLRDLEDNYGIKLEHLHSEELVNRFPGYQFTEQSHAIYDNQTAKELLASGAIHALWEMAPKNGVTTCSPCPVTSVAEVADADGTSRLRVTCKRTPVDPAEYLAKNVILATGAGTSSINITNSRNEPVPLPQVTPQLWAQLYFRKKPDVPCSTNTGFIEWAWQNGGNPMLAWGRPSINTQTDYDFLVGIGDHAEVSSASQMENPATFQVFVQSVQDYVKNRMPCLDENPLFIERAMNYQVDTGVSGGHPLEGISNVYLAIEGTSFGGAPNYAKKLASLIVEASKKDQEPQKSAEATTKTA